MAKWKCKIHSEPPSDTTIVDLLAANGELKREVERLKKENEDLKLERQHYFNRAVNLQLENCQLRNASRQQTETKQPGWYFYEERTTVEVKK